MKLFPRPLRAYLRYAPRGPQYAQDYPTYIMIGRYVHLYNSATDNWFFVSETMPLVEGLPLYLNRERTTIVRVNLRTMLLVAGRRFWLEAAEDFAGFRLTGIAQVLRRFWPFKRWERLERLANLDENQDWSRWHEFEPPRIQGGIEYQ